MNQNKDLQELLNKDITQGYALPINKAAAKKIVSSAWTLLNITEQWTINEEGEHINKKCVTHDQSFQGLVLERSINNIVDITTLEPLIYRLMFMRVVHVIHAMQWAYLDIHILIYKLDLVSAYRQMHISAKTAAKCICSTSICALIYLRLTFGGSFSPAE